MLLSSSPAFTIGTSPRISQTPTVGTPGPASYTPDLTFRISSPRATIGRAKKVPLTLTGSTPGPGSYDIDSKIGSGPKAVIVSRKGKDTSDGPGPGEYESRVVERHPSYTFGHKIDLPEVRIGTPGPGAYTPTAVIPSSPKAIFPQASHQHTAQWDLPGPGSYTPSTPTPESPKFSFFRAGKESHIERDTPGPGSYEYRTDTGTAVTVLPRRSSQTHTTLPGPGSYTPVHHSKSPAYTIGKSKWKAKRPQTPSPADYSPKPLHRASPSHKIGLSQRGLNSSVVGVQPGPGTYNPRNQSSSPRFSMKSRTQKAARSETPVVPIQGPASYTLNTSQILENARRPVIGSEKKSEGWRGCAGPSPADYAIKRDLLGPQYSFSRSLRSREKPEDVPGPGQYSLPSGVANVPSYVEIRRVK